MREVLFRCSSIGKLMTEPRSKSSGPLGETAKSHIRTVAAQDILGVDFEVSSREMEKGIECEPEAIALLNRVRGLSLTKNVERRDNGFITGECDLFHAAARSGFDLKCAWSAGTFPITADDIGGSQRTLYEWQCRGYMALWDADEWTVAYALLNTPTRLIGFEPLPMHVVDHIPEHMRLTVWTIKRDREKEDEMLAKVRHARAYYAQVIAEFHETHRETAASGKPAADMDAPWDMSSVGVTPKPALEPTF